MQYFLTWQFNKFSKFFQNTCLKEQNYYPNFFLRKITTFHGNYFLTHHEDDPEHEYDCYCNHNDGLSSI